jgi:predicted ester cyclase
VEFVIFPNLLVPKGDRDKLTGALEGAERGRKLMAGQKYSITNETVEGDRVALEVEWTGTLAVPFGALPAGEQIKACFAMFLEFREGKMVGQRNYDCFEKW